MPICVVSYDLKQGEGAHDYAQLYQAMEALGARRVLRSVYVVDSEMSARALYDHLRGALDCNDLLWVSRVEPGGFHYRAMKGANDWFRRRRAESRAESRVESPADAPA